MKFTDLRVMFYPNPIRWRWDTIKGADYAIRFRGPVVISQWSLPLVDLVASPMPGGHHIEWHSQGGRILLDTKGTT